MSILAEHIVEVTKGAKDTYAGENNSNKAIDHTNGNADNRGV